MRGLFRSFDPKTGLLSLNWLALISPLFIPSLFWKINSKPLLLLKMIKTKISEEINSTIRTVYASRVNLFLVRLLILIIFNNFFGLLPYVFTCTRHLSITIPLALSGWVGYTTLALRTRFRHFLAHLVPSGTPTPLVPLIVLIEVISQVIRPFTLSIRLAANIIAGHLLLILVRINMPSIGFSILLLAFIGLLLLIFLELGVSLIQGYVFIRLNSLYIGEINAPNL